MHDTTRDFIDEQLKNYEEEILHPFREFDCLYLVLEVGALDVNGTIRTNFERYEGSYQYTGIDYNEGKGVNVVISKDTDWEQLDQYDLVVSTNALEHDPNFHRTIVNIHSHLRIGGMFWLQMPNHL